MHVVSLLPSSTEILFGIGAGDLLVGVTHECDYPPEATRLPALTTSSLPAELQTHPGAESSAAADDLPRKIDRHVRTNVHAGSSLYALDETLLAELEPDLIVTQELCEVCAVSYEIVEGAAKRLRGDPRVISLEPSSLEDVLGTIAFLGELVDRKEGAADLIARLRARIVRLRAAAGDLVPGPRVLVLEWTDPPMGAGHWTPGLVELAGGVPILCAPGENSQTLDWDAIAAADPDVVLAAPCGFDLARAIKSVDALENVPQWRALRAVRNGNVYAIDGSAYVNRPGPRLVDSAEIFAACLREEAVAGAKRVATSRA